MKHNETIFVQHRYEIGRFTTDGGDCIAMSMCNQDRSAKRYFISWLRGGLLVHSGGILEVVFC